MKPLSFKAGMTGGLLKVAAAGDYRILSGEVGQHGGDASMVYEELRDNAMAMTAVNQESRRKRALLCQDTTTYARLWRQDIGTLACIPRKPPRHSTWLLGNLATTSWPVR